MSEPKLPASGLAADEIRPLAQFTPDQLGQWAVCNMLPLGEPMMAERAEGIARRVASIVRGEREGR